MKRLFMLFAVVVIAIGMSGIASAQGNKGGGGKPATTGLDHAESKANANGDKGIENAESKQATNKDKDKDNDKGKAKAKGKNKKKKHSK